jgi:FAD/FMN-containing dehydrogenase
MHQAPSRATIDLAALRADIAGRVIGPDDAEYDKARQTLMVSDLHPVAIIRASTVEDVQRAVNLARETGLELAVRSGGHSAAAHGSTEGGIQLDLADLNAIEIDVEGRTAWAGGGATAGAVTTAVGEHGLVIGFGDTASVGIGGLTTGGGIGFLVRAFGLTIDYLLAADVVTADGALVRADATTNPDLFWAIRGGGGNFGVVTRFQYRLRELPQIVGGLLFLPATAEVVAGFIKAAEEAPDELSTILNVMTAPPMPFIPAEQHGKLVVMGMLTYAGDVEAGQKAVAPFRALATPLADLVRPMPYSGMYPPEEPGAEEYHPVASSRVLFMDRVDLDVARTIVDRLEEHRTSPGVQMVAAQLRVLGGAASRVPVDATAFAHRTSRIMAIVAASVGSADVLPVHQTWVEGLAADLVQGDTGAYVNFVGEEGPERVRDAYPGATWDRLVAIKDRYDPTNVFRRNQNIVPSGRPTA